MISSLGEALGNLISEELIAEINQLSIDPQIEIDDYNEELISFREQEQGFDINPTVLFSLECHHY